MLQTTPTLRITLTIHRDARLATYAHNAGTHLKSKKNTHYAPSLRRKSNSRL